MDMKDTQIKIAQANRARGWDSDAILAAGKLDESNRALLVRHLEAEIAKAQAGEITETEVNAVLAKIGLAIGELSEAVEELRVGRIATEIINGKPEGVVVEMADAVIRIMHLVDMLGGDLAAEIETKMSFNKTRGHRHGGRLA